MNWRRLWAIVVKEMRQMRRDRVTLAMIIGIPVLQLALFGYAINLNLRGLDASITDQAGTAGSRALVMDMLATGVIRPVAETSTADESMDLLRRGKISIGVVIPPDFEQRRIDGRAELTESPRRRLFCKMAARCGCEGSAADLVGGNDDVEHLSLRLSSY